MGALRVLVVALVVVTATEARADNAAELFAHFFQQPVADLTEVRGFKLERVAAYTDVVFARFPTSAGHTQHGAVLLTCDDQQCQGKPVWLEGDSELHVVGLIDLAGAELGLPTSDVGRHLGRNFSPMPRLGTPRRTRLAWPALVVATGHDEEVTADTRFGRVTGRERRHQLVLLSLRRADKFPRVFQESTERRGASGAGTTTSYRLVRDRKRGPLAIVGTEQPQLDDRSLCARPPPIEIRFAWKAGRFQRITALAPGPGC